MGVRRALFGTKKRVVLTVLLVLVTSVVGAYMLGIVGTPAVTGVENRFGAVDDNETTIHTDLGVSNPNPVGVQLGGASVAYTVWMNDVEMAEGGRDGLDLPRGDSTIGFTTQMDNERIPAWWVSHIRNDERTTVNIDATAHSSTLGRSFDLPQERTIRTNLIGQFRSTEDREVNANHRLISDPVLVVRETDARWGNVTERRTPIDMSMTVYNPKTVPYVVTEIGYNVTMNDVRVGNGTTDEVYTIPGGTEKTLDATTAIENDRLDEWWVSHLQNDQRTDLRITFHAKVELPNGDTLRVPLDALTYTRTIETDIFGTKNASTAAGSAANGSGSDSTATPASGATTTGTTATATTTDDGGLLGDGSTDATDTASTPEPTDRTATDSTPTTTETLLGGGSGTDGDPTTTDGSGGNGGTDGGGNGTETDDGGLLGAVRAAASHGMLNSLVT
ncbi:LEA type 2 family protein [Halomarina salina]|uniref:LEA type 2 family protein n=1 Tax=Halomarina salina TaxID=1872699 RepID=A0ABD5RIF4_9EURY|nr:LEA type 2 family protein [Halomarina salina]